MDNILNPSRVKVSDALTKVISHYFGKDNISETILKKSWMEEISSHTELTENGWYNPPSKGSAILVCNSDDVSRSHFKSFRDPNFFANNNSISWKNFILIAYASNVDNKSGVPADFATTAYFGESKNMRNYFKKCFKASNEILSSINTNWTSKQLYSYISHVIAEYGLEGKTWSSTDNNYNFGHTLPSLYELNPLINNVEKILNDDTTKIMRDSRRFVSESSEWKLSEIGQFTIEPQFTIPLKPNFPKAMIHYAVDATSKQLKICNSCEHLPRMLGLL
ncbi:M24 family metallopeptidase [Marinomonas agarivorans]|nr:M24 family metallopeptidase [Marinomonas agarivorans]